MLCKKQIEYEVKHILKEKEKYRTKDPSCWMPKLNIYSNSVLVTFFKEIFLGPFNNLDDTGHKQKITVTGNLDMLNLHIKMRISYS